VKIFFKKKKKILQLADAENREALELLTKLQDAMPTSRREGLPAVIADSVVVELITQYHRHKKGEQIHSFIRYGQLCSGIGSAIETTYIEALVKKHKKEEDKKHEESEEVRNYVPVFFFMQAAGGAKAQIAYRLEHAIKTESGSSWEGSTALLQAPA